MEVTPALEVWQTYGIKYSTLSHFITAVICRRPYDYQIVMYCLLLTVMRMKKVRFSERAIQNFPRIEIKKRNQDIIDTRDQWATLISESVRNMSEIKSKRLPNYH